MVFGAVIAVDAGAVIGLDQLEAILVELRERLIVAIDVIENSELQRHSCRLPRCGRHVEPIIRTCHAFGLAFRDRLGSMRIILAAIIAGVLGLASPVHAQDWPSRQITIVVPFGAGGSADLLARILATHMQAKFGQPVVVENRAGAGGNIGTATSPRPRPTATRCCSARSARSRSTPRSMPSCRSTSTRTSSRSPSLPASRTCWSSIPSCR